MGRDAPWNQRQAEGRRGRDLSRYGPGPRDDRGAAPLGGRVQSAEGRGGDGAHVHDEASVTAASPSAGRRGRGNLARGVFIMMFQVRLHGRGGQGTVTAAELLSVAAFHQGQFAQAFPSFGSERMGAPVMAFCRLDTVPIRLREPVVEPDAVLIQDATLLHCVDVFQGLRPGGVAVAVGHGKKAARHIDAYLRGAVWTPPPRHELAGYAALNPWYYTDADRTVHPTLDALRRRTTFDEVHGG